MSNVGVLRPCSCGSQTVVHQQRDPQTWEARCYGCSAHVYGKDAAEVAELWNATQFKLYDRQQLKFQNGNVKDCCKDPRNLIFKQRKFDLTTYVCRVCGCRHRRMLAEPGRIYGKASVVR